MTAYDTLSFEPLAPRALTAARIGALLLAIMLALVGALPLWLLTVRRGEAGAGTWLLLLAGWALLVALLGWWRAGAAWRHAGWRLDEDGLLIRRGVFWRSETRVPRSRVQHVDLEHGPVDRRFGLATLKIHTAGTRLAAVTLGGLERERAEALRDALVADDAVPQAAAGVGIPGVADGG